MPAGRSRSVSPELRRRRCDNGPGRRRFGSRRNTGWKWFPIAGACRCGFRPNWGCCWIAVQLRAGRSLPPVAHGIALGTRLGCFCSTGSSPAFRPVRGRRASSWELLRTRHRGRGPMGLVPIREAVTSRWVCAWRSEPWDGRHGNWGAAHGQVSREPASEPHLASTGRSVGATNSQLVGQQTELVMPPNVPCGQSARSAGQAPALPGDRHEELTQRQQSAEARGGGSSSDAVPTGL